MYTVLCDYVMSAEGGKQAFVGTFINVELSQMPGSLNRFCVAMGFTGEVGDEYRLSIIGPSGREFLEIGAGTVGKKSNTENVVVLNTGLAEFGNFPFPSEGIYQVVLWEGDKARHRRRFGVRLAEKVKGNGNELDAGS